MSSIVTRCLVIMAKINFEVQSLHQFTPVCTRLHHPILGEELSSQYSAHWKQGLRQSCEMEGFRLCLRARVHLPEAIATYDKKLVDI